MKIRHDEPLFTCRTPTLPSNLNIKLARSLNCLNIPLETFVGFNGISLSKSRMSMVGSVDRISEIQQQSNCEKCIRLPPSLIHIGSIVDQTRPPLKYRLPAIDDSVVRLRRSGRLQNIHQSSLSQIINDVSQRRRRNGSIPKFSCRPLPSAPRPSTVSRTSPFTSLPEIRSFVEQSCVQESRSIIIEKFIPSQSISSSCWKKSSSWSWKSNGDIESNRINPTVPNQLTKKMEYQIDDDLFRPYLPVIIESPVQRHLPLRSSELFPHSISNYEMSSTRFASTPFLAHINHELTPLATFDEETCSISSSESSFRSCLNSIDTFESSVESCSQEISIDYDEKQEPIVHTSKHSRFSFRHACSIQ